MIAGAGGATCAAGASATGATAAERADARFGRGDGVSAAVAAATGFFAGALFGAGALTVTGSGADASGAGEAVRRARVSFGAYCFFFGTGAASGSTVASTGDASATGGLAAGGSTAEGVTGSGATVAEFTTGTPVADVSGLMTFDVEAAVRRRRGAIEGGVGAVGAVEVERVFEEPDLPLAMM